MTTTDEATQRDEARAKAHELLGFGRFGSCRDAGHQNAPREQCERLAGMFIAFDEKCDRLTEVQAQLATRNRELGEVRAERDSLKSLLNTPEVLEFVDAVQLEAAHQRARWKPEDDAAKTDADWFWLIGWLGGKAVHNPGETPATPNASAEKRLHRIITVAAAACNWHAARRRTYLESIGIPAAPYEEMP